MRLNSMPTDATGRLLPAWRSPAAQAVFAARSLALSRSHLWHRAGMAKDPRPGCIFVVIEIPRGSRNKYEIDHDDNRVFLDRRLFTATTYPADYGFVPHTLGGDGDPLDALVLLDDPVYPGVWVEARPIGVLYMQDEAGEDAKLICVPPGEPRWEGVHDVSDMTPQLMAEIQHFFEVYKALEPNKYSSTQGIGGRDEAWREIESARANYAR
jgi:inorganic pyrophosphatase